MLRIIFRYAYQSTLERRWADRRMAPEKLMVAGGGFIILAVAGGSGV